MGGFGLGVTGLLGGHVCAAAADIVTQHDQVRLGHGTQTLKIGFASDPHIVEPWTPLSTLRKIVTTFQNAGVDMIVWGGDFSGHALPQARLVFAHDIAQTLASWHPPLGHVAVMGNHDWMVNAAFGGFQDGQLAMEAALRQQGVRVLRNQAQSVNTPAGPLWLAGQDSDSPPRSLKTDRRPANIRTTLTDTMGDRAPCVLIAHEPDVFATRQDRVQLQLSGHLHGGQVRLGGWTPGHLPSRYGDRYLHGRHTENDQTLIVSAGTGYSRLPVRWGVPAEIHILTLTL